MKTTTNRVLSLFDTDADEEVGELSVEIGWTYSINPGCRESRSTYDGGYPGEPEHIDELRGKVDRQERERLHVELDRLLDKAVKMAATDSSTRQEIMADAGCAA